MGKRLWSACSHLPHHVPQCRDSPSSRRGSRAPQRDASQAAAAPVPQARVRVDPLAAALTGDAIMRALPALQPGANAGTRGPSQTARADRTRAGRTGKSMEKQYDPRVFLEKPCLRPVLASGQYRSVIAHHSVNANQSPPVFPHSLSPALSASPRAVPRHCRKSPSTIVRPIITARADS